METKSRVSIQPLLQVNNVQFKKRLCLCEFEKQVGFFRFPFNPLLSNIFVLSDTVFEQINIVGTEVELKVLSHVI
jgi:hypothetical protein